MGLRYEEHRSSEAAQNIALNFQTSQSSDLTFDKDKELLDYANYPDLTNDEPPAEHLAKSVSQIKTNATDQAGDADHITDQCGDGQTRQPPPPPANCSIVIDQAVGLEKSKKMIVNLIDSAIQQLKKRDSDSKQSLLQKGDGASVSVSTSTDESGKRDTTRRLKMECIGKLEAELMRLKMLEEFNE